MKSKLHHIYRRKSGVYYLQHSKVGKISLRTKDIDKAILLRNEMLKEIDYRGYLPMEKFNSKTFLEVLKEWWDRKKKTLRKTTLYNHKIIINKHFIKADFVNKPISEITPIDIENFWMNLNVSNNSKLDYLVKLGNIFKYALKAGYITSNPLDRIEKPKRENKKPSPYQVEDINKILAVIDPFYNDFFTIRFMIGARPSEISGLKEEHIDFQNNVIKIRQGVVRGRIGAPKNSYSVRDIVMSDKVREIMKKRVENCNGGYLFTNRRGGFISSHTISTTFAKACEKAGVEHKSPYTSRHSFISNTIKRGADISFISKQVGHANVNTLVRFYLGYLKGNEKDEQKVNEFTNKITTQSTTPEKQLKLFGEDTSG